MRHILSHKVFENNSEYKRNLEKDADIRYHKGIIKDIFQDLFDEYDMEEYINNDYRPVARDGMFYYIRKDKYGDLIIIEIFPGSNDPTGDQNLKIKKMKLDGYKQRLEAMGYSVRLDWIDYNSFIKTQEEARWLRITINYENA